MPTAAVTATVTPSWRACTAASSACRGGSSRLISAPPKPPSASSVPVTTTAMPSAKIPKSRGASSLASATFATTPKA